MAMAIEYRLAINPLARPLAAIKSFN